MKEKKGSSVLRTVIVTFISLTLSAFLVGSIHGGNSKTSVQRININHTVIAADFKTLHECLETIKKNTGSTLTIITENQVHISGFLSNGEHFACVEKVTEAKGTYVDGWYTIK